MAKDEIRLQLGHLASGCFYEWQEFRKGTANRIRDLVFRKDKGIGYRELQDKKTKTAEEKEWLKEYTDKNLPKRIKGLLKAKKLDRADFQHLEKLQMLLADVSEKEKQYKTMVLELVKEEKVYKDFAQYIPGLAELSCASLLYFFGYCEKAKYPSSLWCYAGLTPDSKYVKGESSGFNKRCRMFMWRVVDSFIKNNFDEKSKDGVKVPGRYRKIYLAEKARQMQLLENKADNAPSRLGHADARARRKTMKHFLADYYRFCKTVTGQEQAKPYVIDKMGHTHFDDIMVYLDTRQRRSI